MKTMEVEWTDKPQTMEASSPRLWTVSEAAAYLRKSESWVWQAVRTPQDQLGSIPHAKLGKSPRFIADDLQAWAASGFPPADTFRFSRESNRLRRL